MRSTRILLAVLITVTIQCVAGCAAWQARSWDLSQFRDPRAADIDSRLQQRPDPSGEAFAGLTGADGP